MKKFIAIASLAVLSFAAIAQNTPRVDQREANQQQRINQGVASGQLTGKEAANLQNQQNRIQAAEGRAKADGVLTAQERKNITKRQNKANRDIYRKKHNRKTA
jgi:uncharacterized membrane protein YebE (DUF533 family)